MIKKLPMKQLTTKQTSIELPIFPLPVFLLPEGVTKLRIFEPRYLKMVSVASSGQGFVIWLNDNSIKADVNDGTMLWGSWVEIINFDQGDDGVLEIDVKCKSLVVINSVMKSRDSFNVAKVSDITHWSQKHADNVSSELATSLEHVFAENDNLNELYPKKSLGDSHWVLARWLEILPIELNVKSGFVVNYNFQEAKRFVESVIFD
ncbi:hypothetical protein FCS21_13485 [Colwellia ponticola]|uniref:Lon N-terminal domain-containing protein n=2 Tax=Colwellia ponticola TaxID=2304625 RepID=A0A8H2PLT3_9GAMM|nr:hypothetical protein FCS21_13485 [Colwellia ponticola]